MKEYALEWHSIRTGMEGIGYELADTPDHAKQIYENKYHWREVKIISEVGDGDGEHK